MEEHVAIICGTRVQFPVMDFFMLFSSVGCVQQELLDERTKKQVQKKS